jgi:hypothetical protein
MPESWPKNMFVVDHMPRYEIGEIARFGISDLLARIICNVRPFGADYLQKYRYCLPVDFIPIQLLQVVLKKYHRQRDLLHQLR